MIDSIVTGGTGLFANATGWGKEVVQIIASNEGPPTYVSRGQFSIPEPSTAALLLGAALVVGTLRRRRT